MKISSAITFGCLFGLVAIASLEAAPPVAQAGPDLVVSDFDGNQSVTVTLDARSTTDADDDIVSWEWAWPGGSANGEVAEGTFTASDAPVTVTLTITDAASNITTDTLQVSAYRKETALFTDFTKQTYRDIGGGLEGRVAGNLLMIDFANRDAFRRSGGTWVPETFPTSASDHFPVDENTVVSLESGFGGPIQVTRRSAGTWTANTITVTPSYPELAGFNNQRKFAMDTETAVIADYGSDRFATDAGEVRVYDWSGNTWTQSALLAPPGGWSAGMNFGQQIELQGDTIVVSRVNTVTSTNVFHVFRKTSGVWGHEITFDGTRSVSDPVGQFYWNFGYGNGVLASTRVLPSGYELALYQRVGASWQQTIIATPSVGASPFERVVVDTDGDAFAVSGFEGNHFLFRRGASFTQWSGATVNTQRLLTSDSPGLRVSDFSDNLLTLRDGIAGRVRLIDSTTAVSPVNVEPVANAGLDINTTSFNGQPVTVFLNGGASYDIDFDETLTAEWSWNGGSANGLLTFASIPPSVNSIELRLTDSKGAISRDTISVNIVAPPVIAAGPDRVVVDSDGDRTIRLKVDGQVISQDHPVASHSWTWPGGVLGSQSGTITLGQPADGEVVSYNVIDESGLSSHSGFTFSLLDPDPVPDVIVPADGQNNDLFGYSVAIDGASALVGALNKSNLGATYQLENINGVWQQIPIQPGTKQGSALSMSEDFAFSGAFRGGNDLHGRVNVLTKNGGQWTTHSTLAPPSEFGLSPHEFGLTLSRNGDYLVVGAPASSVTAPGFSSRAGAAYVFRLTGGAWIFERSITSPTPETDGGFGTAVALHGDTLAIGSRAFEGNLNSGIIHVFERTGTNWNLVATLESDVWSIPIAGIDSFGRSLAMNATEILAGAPEDPLHATGSVYRFTKSAGVWQPNGRILPIIPPAPPTPNFSFFGSSLSLDGNVLVVGVPGDATGPNEGGIQTFILRNGNWQHSGSLSITPADDPAIGANYIYFAEGSSLHHDKRNLIVGATRARTASGVQTGKAYIYRNYAALDPDANYEPVAHAGPDINVNDTLIRGPAPDYLITEPLGSELVTLNGSASTDRENAIASYEWTWPGGSASGITAAARFPVGTTTVTLTVTDDGNVVQSDTVTVTVALPQTSPGSVPVTTGNTLTVNFPVPEAKWRLSSEFLWHGDGESVNDVVLGEDYQVEIIPWPGAVEPVTTIVTIDTTNAVADLNLVMPVRPVTTGIVRFPETAQGFTWRLTGESSWRNVTDNNNGTDDLIAFDLPVGDYRIEFKPVTGYATPQSRVIGVRENLILGLNWSDYLRINNFDVSKTFKTATPNLGASPYQYTGMIRTPLGRGTGTVVAERVVLTAGHLFFDSTGLQWADTQWFSRQQQGTRQAPPVTPRGILYRTSYAKLVAPDSVEGTMANLPDDDQEVDFAVLYFSTESDWQQGSANFLQSSSARDWLTGTENKRALGYPQRSQPYELRGMMFEKSFTTPLSPLDANPLPKLFETGEVFGDGGASGSALFVQPQGAAASYPAAILLAGQGRAVYHVIDDDVGRMIKDGQDAASGNDEVLDNNSSLVTYGGLGGFTTLAVNIGTPAVLSTARWSVTPNSGTGYSNLKPTQQVAYNANWASFTISFSAVSGFVTPPPRTFLKAQIALGGTNTLPVIYEPVTGYDLWKQTRSIPSDDDDRDHDGHGALVEYAINGNPDSGRDPVPLRMAANPLQNVNAEFEVFVSSTADAIRYTVKASNTLPPTNVSTLATFTKADGNNGYKRVTDGQPKSASKRRFAWVEITHDRSLSTGP